MSLDENLLEIISNNLFRNNKNLHHINNKLECLCLNTSCKEKEKYFEFIEKLIENTNKKLSKNLDFVIVTNNIKFDLKIKKLQDFFNKVKIINLKLSSKDDLYVPFELEQEYIKNNKIPSYGTKSGPNIMFFDSMKLLKEYNTSLLLETDCILSSDWLEKITQYVENSNGFLVSGSVYDGNQFSSDIIMLTHLNGVALYATGFDLFQSMIEHFEQYFLEHVKTFPNIAYDWGLKIFIKNNLEKENNHQFWKFLNRNYVVNKYILNFSLKKDQKTCEKELMKLYNYAILHKK